MINLTELVNLEDQTVKTHFFWDLYLRDQNRVMISNALKNKTELMKKSLKDYLKWSV